MASRCQRKICLEYKVWERGGKKNYRPGVKYCAVCGLFMQLPKEMIDCPCCSTKLRLSP